MEGRVPDCQRQGLGCGGRLSHFFRRYKQGVLSPHAMYASGGNYLPSLLDPHDYVPRIAAQVFAYASV
jgi:hypothetical protein